MVSEVELVALVYTISVILRVTGCQIVWQVIVVSCT